MSKTPKSTPSRGNVFADLGFPNPDEMIVKAELVRQITGIIAQRGLTQTEAARVLGVTQPKISALVRGRLTDFSMERLMRFLVALGQQVDITVRSGRRAGFRVLRKAS